MQIRNKKTKKLKTPLPEKQGLKQKVAELSRFDVQS